MKGKQVARRGRPSYKPTDADRNTVRSMAACGFTHEMIAACLGTDGIDKKTMYKLFRNDLDTAAVRANAVIANVAYQAAARGEAWAVCFWLKCRAKWRETDPKLLAADHSQGDFTLEELLISYRRVSVSG